MDTYPTNVPKKGWHKLPAPKATNEIALGIQADGLTIWSPAQKDDFIPNNVVWSVSIDRLGSKIINLDGKYGTAFNESKVMSYQMYLRVAIAS